MPLYIMREKTIVVSLMSELLIQTRGNLSQVAKQLGINRGTLYNYYDKGTDMLLIKNGDKWIPVAPISRRDDAQDIDIRELIFGKPK